MAAPCLQAEPAEPTSWAFGLRNHVNNSAFTLVPFNDDLSYELMYEAGADGGYWQLALGYTPHVTKTAGKDAIDYVMTPQFNIVFEDPCWQMRFGAGVLYSYISYEEKGGDWSDMYWQLLGGFTIPLGSSMNLDLMAFYVFEDWNELSKYKSDDIELGAWLKYTF
jgi:hypothetical protein